MGVEELPLTGTCDLETVGRRSGRPRRVEIWYVVVDQQIVVTGTPGARHWLGNLREDPQAALLLREPARRLTVTAHEVTDLLIRRRIAEQARRLQPWYAEQPFSVDDWVADSPMVILTPRRSDGADRAHSR